MLNKDPSTGIGLKLAGGRSGLFVASIIRGGAAEREGSIHVGDRLVAITNRNAEGELLDCASDTYGDWAD